MISDKHRIAQLNCELDKAERKLKLCEEALKLADKLSVEAWAVLSNYASAGLHVAIRNYDKAREATL